MPTEPPLTDDERTVLQVLMAPGSRPINTTVQAVGDRSELGVETAGRVLRDLMDREPPLVREVWDQGIEVRFYTATYDAADAYEDAPG